MRPSSTTQSGQGSYAVHSGAISPEVKKLLEISSLEKIMHALPHDFDKMEPNRQKSTIFFYIANQTNTVWRSNLDQVTPRSSSSRVLINECELTYDEDLLKQQVNKLLERMAKKDSYTAFLYDEYKKKPDELLNFILEDVPQIKASVAWPKEQGSKAELEKEKKAKRSSWYRCL